MQYSDRADTIFAALSAQACSLDRDYDCKVARLGASLHTFEYSWEYLSTLPPRVRSGILPLAQPLGSELIPIVFPNATGVTVTP
jgi:hypothetical protein